MDFRPHSIFFILQLFFLLYSTYQGWDNPFRPEGELSHDAEEILRLWKDGKLKDFSLLLKAGGGGNNNPDQDKEDEVDNTTKAMAKEPLLKNGTPQNGQSKNLVDSSKSSMAAQQQPLRSEKVKIGSGDEPKKKQGCCSLM